MIFLMLITFLWSYIAGNLNGMDTVEISQMIRNKYCLMQIVLFFFFYYIWDFLKIT